MGLKKKKLVFGIIIIIISCAATSVLCREIALASPFLCLTILINSLVYFALAFIFKIGSKERRVMFFFGVCCLLVGLWLFMNSDEAGFFVRDPAVAGLVVVICQSLISPVFFVFIKRLYKESWGGYALDRPMDAIIFLLALCAPISVWVQWRFSFNLPDSPVMESFFLLVAAANFPRLWVSMMKETRSIPAVGLAVVMCLIYTMELLREVFSSPFFEDRIFLELMTLVLLNATWIIFMRETYLRLEESNAMREQLAQGRVQLMLSQIQPHFIYNTLNSIHIMIRKDPDVACRMITNFSAYLRANMSAMGTQRLATIKEEIAHVQAYVEIEKIRFPKIDVQYEIDEWSFNLPVLTVQPLVENAIKHGVSKTRSGGVVIIRAYRSIGYVYIEVKDNGAGFDTARLESESASIGIRNVRYRLEKMMGGSLSIKSGEGAGTVAVIKLPIHEAERR